jgi:hypothetical protein
VPAGEHRPRPRRPRRPRRPPARRPSQRARPVGVAAAAGRRAACRQPGQVPARRQRVAATGPDKEARERAEVPGRRCLLVQRRRPGHRRAGHRGDDQTDGHRSRPRPGQAARPRPLRSGSRRRRTGPIGRTPGRPPGSLSRSPRGSQPSDRRTRERDGDEGGDRHVRLGQERAHHHRTGQRRP